MGEMAGLYSMAFVANTIKPRPWPPRMEVPPRFLMTGPNRGPPFPAHRQVKKSVAIPPPFEHLEHPPPFSQPVLALPLSQICNTLSAHCRKLVAPYPKMQVFRWLCVFGHPLGTTKLFFFFSIFLANFYVIFGQIQCNLPWRHVRCWWRCCHARLNAVVHGWTLEMNSASSLGAI